MKIGEKICLQGGGGETSIWEENIDPWLEEKKVSETTLTDQETRPLMLRPRSSMLKKEDNTILMRAMRAKEPNFQERLQIDRICL